MSLNRLPNRKYRVLLVEDNESVAEGMKLLLAPLCSSVIVKSDGLSAYRAVLDDEDGFDMVLSDIQMPKMNGIELLSKLKAIKPELPVVLVSAFDEKEYLHSAIEHKAEHYLIKPIKKDDIKSLFDRCFGRTTREVEEFLYHEIPCSYEYLSGTLTVGNERVLLNRRENQLMKLFFSNKNQTLTSLEMGLALWGDENMTKDCIHSFIRRFRKKLPDGLIKLHRRGVYRLDIVPIEGAVSSHSWSS